MRKLWNLLYSNPTWLLQFSFCTIGSVVILLFFFVNYYVLPQPVVCYQEPYSPWMKDYVFLILGAGIGQTFIQYFRVITAYFFVEGSLRHPLATLFIMLIFSLYTIHLLIFYFDLMPYTCESFFGLRTPPTMWLEAIVLTPMQFFLSIMLDVKKSSMSKGDFYAQYAVTLAFFIIFFMNTEFLPRYVHVACYLTSMVIMFAAIYWMIRATVVDYRAAKQEYDQSLINEEIPASKRASSAEITTAQSSQRKLPASDKSNHSTLSSSAPPSPHNSFPERDQISYRKEVYDRFHVAGWRVIAMFFNLAIYFFYYGTFHLAFFSLDSEVIVLLVIFYSFFLKMAYFQIIGDSHVEILDPNKFLLIEERKKSDESRMTLFRYVFHEIRVPLNAVSLGLQILSENKQLMHSDEDTVSTMQDSTVFMSQTLNDVISLQKLEQGTLKIEHQLFDPRVLIDLVLGNFRYNQIQFICQSS